jgi:glutaredoxin|tara:strand:- start:955 stop:1194 length:240 start_codon:yes stop_codon:yes gene_type:complete
MAKITLYQYENCPFCMAVRDKLEELGLKYEKVEMSRDHESQERKDLAQKSGVMTVPVIDIDGEFTGESDAIIEKLEKMN